MGLIKAVVLLSVALVLSDMITKWAKKYEEHPYYKFVAPYLSSRCRIILFIVVLILILL